MAVKDWSTTAASNTAIISGMSLDGTIMTVSQTDNAFRDVAAQIASQLGKMGFKGADIASATTTNLANATGWYVDITGTTTITGLGTVDAGQMFMLRFAGALTFTHNATSLILPGAANITTAAGDVATMVSLGSGNWRCVAYTAAAGGLVTLTGTQTLTNKTLTAPVITGLDASLTAKGIIEIATAAEYLTGTDDERALTPGQVYDAAAEVTLTDAATIAVDMSTGINFFVTLGGNRTLGNPTNAKPGQSGCITIDQDATGSRTLAFSSNWKFAGGVDPVLSTAATAHDLLFYYVRTSTFIYASLNKTVF